MSRRRRGASASRHGRRLRALIVVLWRAGLRIREALALSESDLDCRRGSLLVWRGKGGRRGEVRMDEWAWEQLQPWLDLRRELPIGPLFCVIQRPDAQAPVVRGGGAPRPATNGPLPPACGDGSHRISCVTRMPSRRLARVCR